MQQHWLRGRQAGRDAGGQADGQTGEQMGWRTGRLEGGQVDEEAIRKVGQPRMRAGKLY